MQHLSEYIKEHQETSLRESLINEDGSLIDAALRGLGNLISDGIRGLGSLLKDGILKTYDMTLQGIKGAFQLGADALKGTAKWAGDGVKDALSKGGDNSTKEVFKNYNVSAENQDKFAKNYSDTATKCLIGAYASTLQNASAEEKTDNSKQGADDKNAKEKSKLKGSESAQAGAKRASGPKEMSPAMQKYFKRIADALKGKNSEDVFKNLWNVCEDLKNDKKSISASDSKILRGIVLKYIGYMSALTSSEKWMDSSIDGFKALGLTKKEDDLIQKVYEELKKVKA